MRALLIGALAATLVGCSCLLPPQASMEESNLQSDAPWDTPQLGQRPRRPTPKFNNLMVLRHHKFGTVGWDIS